MRCQGRRSAAACGVPAASAVHRVCRQPSRSFRYTHLCSTRIQGFLGSPARLNPLALVLSGSWVGALSRGSCAVPAASAVHRVCRQPSRSLRYTQLCSTRIQGILGSPARLNPFALVLSGSWVGALSRPLCQPRVARERGIAALGHPHCAVLPRRGLVVAVVVLAVGGGGGAGCWWWCAVAVGGCVLLLLLLLLLLL